MSIASMQRDRHAALATLFKAFRIHQTRSFKYDPAGPNMAGLRLCERFGWLWFEAGRAAITSEGLRELEPYRRSEPKPLVQTLAAAGYPGGWLVMTGHIRHGTSTPDGADGAAAGLQVAHRPKLFPTGPQQRRHLSPPGDGFGGVAPMLPRIPVT
jgi:hypothetical protein